VSTLKEQFEKRDADKPKPKWVYGDRISGKVGGIPVVGQVIREDYVETDLVLVHLDLPINVSGEYQWIVHVPSKGMKRLKEIV
jgi:hypothetical protein